MGFNLRMDNIFHRRNIILPFTLVQLVIMREFGTLLLCRAQQTADLICSQPEVPENGHIIFASEGPSLPGTRIRYECDTGFLRLGVTHRECLKNGTWSDRAPICAVNVALYKPTRQSSTSASSGFNLNSNFSTDGDFQGQCSTTQAEVAPWLEVDLLQNFRIFAVEILFQKRLKSSLQSDGQLATAIRILEIKVRRDSVSNAAFSGPSNNFSSDSSQEKSILCYRFTSQLAANAVHSFVCENEPFGRFITINAYGDAEQATTLGICEVSVLSRFAASPWLCNSIPGMDTWDIHSGSCFYGSVETQPWFSAGAHCRLNGASLLADVNGLSQRFLVSQLEGRGRPQAQFYWSGLTNTRTGEWKWITGEPLLESSWSSDSNGKIPNPDLAYAAALARSAGWNWVPSVQGLWYHWICKSKPLFCASPGVPQNGGIMLSSPRYTTGSIAYYYCSYGFQLAGPESRTCKENGTWSGDVPECLAVNCGDPEPIAGAEVQYTNGSTLYDSTVQYQCLHGMRLFGPSIRKCQINGRWSGNAPACRAVDCGLPENVTNGQLTLQSNTTLLGSVVQYSCKLGFALVGTNLRHCTAAGFWVPPAPVCYDASAIRSSNPNNGNNVAETDNGQYSSNSNPTLHIMVGFLAIVIILVVLVAVLIFWVWRKKKEQHLLSSFSSIYAPPSLNVDGTMVPYDFSNGGYAPGGEHIYYSNTSAAPLTPRSASSSDRSPENGSDRGSSALPVYFDRQSQCYAASSLPFTTLVTNAGSSCGSSAGHHADMAPLAKPSSVELAQHRRSSPQVHSSTMPHALFPTMAPPTGRHTPTNYQRPLSAYRESTTSQHAHLMPVPLGKPGMSQLSKFSPHRTLSGSMLSTHLLMELRRAQEQNGQMHQNTLEAPAKRETSNFPVSGDRLPLSAFTNAQLHRITATLPHRFARRPSKPKRPPLALPKLASSDGDACVNRKGAAAGESSSSNGEAPSSGGWFGTLKKKFRKVNETSDSGRPTPPRVRRRKKSKKRQGADSAVASGSAAIIKPRPSIVHLTPINDAHVVDIDINGNAVACTTAHLLNAANGLNVPRPESPDSGDSFSFDESSCSENESIASGGHYANPDDLSGEKSSKLTTPAAVAAPQSQQVCSRNSLMTVSSSSSNTAALLPRTASTHGTFYSTKALSESRKEQGLLRSNRESLCTLDGSSIYPASSKKSSLSRQSTSLMVTPAQISSQGILASPTADNDPQSDNIYDEVPGSNSQLQRHNTVSSAVCATTAAGSGAVAMATTNNDSGFETDQAFTVC